MKHHEVYIDVWNREARIARWINLTPSSWTRELAVNSEALALAAEEEVYRQGKTITINGHCDCSPELAAQAQWSEE